MVYSGGALDGLLSVVTSLGGDRLRLQTGQTPAAFAGSRPLRLTLPAASSSMLRALCGDMVGAHEAGARGESESRFDYATGDETRFDVRITGSFADDASASIVVVRAGASSNEQRADAASGPRQPGLEQRRAEPAANGGADLAPNGGAEPAVNGDAFPALSSARASEHELDGALTQVIAAAVSAGATDIHLTEGEPPVFRTQGRLETREGPAFELRSLLPDEARRERVLAGHAVDFAFTFRGTHRLRGNVYLAQQGVCAALRILTRSAPELSELGLPEEVTALTRVQDGLVLFCGCTGAGKSTSLAAITRSLLENTAGLCIALESPIEYDLSPRLGQSRVRQREVGLHVSSFPAGLRDALREDPDYILVGEMRDRETAALALTAAETGHLVLSSLHCRSAASAVERIVDLFASEQQRQIRSQLADCLRAVVSQQLLPARRGEGRVVAAEVLTINAAAAHLIREGKTEQLHTVLHSGKHAGMLPLERHLVRLVKAGRVEPAVARARARFPELFDPGL